MGGESQSARVKSQLPSSPKRGTRRHAAGATASASNHISGAVCSLRFTSQAISLLPDVTLTSTADRVQLYIEVINSAPLWQAAFLMTRTWHVLNENLLSQKPYQGSLLFMKGEALKALTVYTSQNKTSGPVIAAIALLAAWELVSVTTTCLQRVHFVLIASSVMGISMHIEYTQMRGHR